jgi:hypothetical protein
MHARKNRKTLSKKKFEKLFEDSQGRKIPARYLKGFKGKKLKQRIKEIEDRRDEYDEMYEDGVATQDELDRVFRPFETDKGVKKKPSSYTVEAKRRGFTGSLREKSESALKYYKASASQTNINKVEKQLKKVNSKGIAAWASGGHRPGASKWNWGSARVNSFLVGGKTFWTTDKRQANNLPKKMRTGIMKEAMYDPKTKKRKNPRTNDQNLHLLIGTLVAFYTNAQARKRSPQIRCESKAVDLWTIVHATAGYVAVSRYDLKQETVAQLAVAYEIVEPYITEWLYDNYPQLGWGFESPTNVTIDILVAMYAADLATKRKEQI